MLNRNASVTLVTLALATAIHLDWHVARPTVHHLSLGLPAHWLLAIPVFGLVAWYVVRVWPSKVPPASIAILASAIILGGVVEPAWEYFLGGASYEWAFGRARTVILAAFVGTGLVAYVAVVAFLRRSTQAAGLNTGS
jgi:hypothetical protein